MVATRPGSTATATPRVATATAARSAAASSPGAARRSRALDGSGSLSVQSRGLALDAHFGAQSGHALAPALTAIARIPDGIINVTEKRALLPAWGSLRLGDRVCSLDHGVAGYDLTRGLLARRTQWRWAFSLGKTSEGEPLALNLVEGFVGAPECAIWLGDTVTRVGEGRVSFDRERPEEPWSVRTADGSVDLQFTPGDFHREERDLVVASARFVQGVGRFSGRITVPGQRERSVNGALGVTEDQNTLW